MIYRNMRLPNSASAPSITRATIPPTKMSGGLRVIRPPGCGTKGRNKHHFEYWTDYDVKTHMSTPVKMPLKYVIEMFCDRVAASKIYKGKAYTDRSAYEYFASAKNTRSIHPQTSAFLEMLLIMLCEEGEDRTFSYIRNYLKTHRDYEA